MIVQNMSEIKLCQWPGSRRRRQGGWSRCAVGQFERLQPWIVVISAEMSGAVECFAANLASSGLI
jgi:hypothetical protein